MPTTMYSYIAQHNAVPDGFTPAQMRDRFQILCSEAVVWHESLCPGWSRSVPGSRDLQFYQDKVVAVLDSCGASSQFVPDPEQHLVLNLVSMFTESVLTSTQFWYFVKETVATNMTGLQGQPNNDVLPEASAMLAFFCGAFPVINTMSEASFRMLLHTASQKTEMHHGSTMSTSELIAVKLVKLFKHHCNFITTSHWTIDQFWVIAKTLCTSCVQLQTSQVDALFDMGIHLEINPYMPPRAYHFRFFAQRGHDGPEDLDPPYNTDI